MNQDIAIQKCLQSVSDQLGGLTTRQQIIIKEHFNLVFVAGIESAYKVINRPNIREIIATNRKGEERVFPSMSEAVRILKVDRADIYRNIKGKRNFSKGYKFKYKQDEKSMDY